MAEGVFQTDRAIFNNPIWRNPAKFRLFFYIYGNAVFAKEGVDVGGIHISRGQFLKSYRNLADELEYLENRSVKKYSISNIKRLCEELAKEKRVKLEVTELGTLFTVLNYEQYQGFERFQKLNQERCENGERTARERRENNNKNDKNDKNEKNVKNVKNDKKINNTVLKTQYAESVTLSEVEYIKLVTEHGEQDTKRMIEILNNYKLSSGKKYKSDYHAILNWVVKRLAEEKQRAPRVDKPGDQQIKSPAKNGTDKYENFYL